MRGSRLAAVLVTTTIDSILAAPIMLGGYFGLRESTSEDEAFHNIPFGTRYPIDSWLLHVGVGTAVVGVIGLWLSVTAGLLQLEFKSGYQQLTLAVAVLVASVLVCVAARHSPRGAGDLYPALGGAAALYAAWNIFWLTRWRRHPRDQPATPDDA